MLYIGDIRRALLRSGASRWNAWVRNVTAWLEGGWLVRSEVYRVRRGLQVWNIHTAKEVVAFLWGRDVTQYKVWVRSRRVELTTGNLIEVERILTEAENEPLP